VKTEAAQADCGERQEAQRRGERRPTPLAPIPAAQHQEREHEPGGELDADTRDQCSCPGPKARARARAQQQGERQQQQDQRVVVRTPDSQYEQHGIQPHECRRPARAMPEALRRPRDQRDRAETRGECHGFQHPQPAGQSEGGAGIARQREQGSVGRVLERPSDERKDGVCRSFCRDVGVGVQPVQRAHSGKSEVAEDVLGEQRGAERHDHVRQHDREGDRTERQSARSEQHEPVARAHDQRQGLKAAVGQGRAEFLKRAGHPRGPTAAAGGNEFRGPGRRAGAQQQDRRQHPCQPEHTEHACDPARGACAAACVGARRRAGGDVKVWYRRGRLHPLHCCACPGLQATMQASSATASL
jgi:hypothetical protein